MKHASLLSLTRRLRSRYYYYEMSGKGFSLAAVAWLKVTDFMQGWLQKELGGGTRMGGKRVISLYHLDGARDVLRLETCDDVNGDDEDMEPDVQENSMSVTRYGCIDAGLALDPKATERLYGIGREELSLYVPIECPRTCLTPDGVLRPWTSDRCFGRQQANELLRLIREAFWRGVAEYDREYARRTGSNGYPAIDMIEAFCRDMGTSDLHADAMRREWQRQRKKYSSLP